MHMSGERNKKMPFQLVSLGIFVILIGFALVIIGSLMSQKGDAKVAVGGFIGFIPFGFANDKKMLYVLLMIMTLAIMLFFIFTYLRK
jgi:uncharacterized membrane protein